MSLPFHLRGATAIALGAALAWFAVGPREAHAGLICDWFARPRCAVIDCPVVCCDPCDAVLCPTISNDPPAEDPAGDPGTSIGGGSGSNRPPITGTPTVFGNEGSFNGNRFRTGTASGMPRLGSGGGAGGGGGAVFSGGLLLPSPTPASTGSTSTGGTGGGPDEVPTSSPSSSPPPGSTLSNPILPDPGSNFIFHYVVDPGGPGTTTPLYFDPPAANGFLFQILSGPNFASVEVPDLPAATGHNVFTLTFGTMTETLISGTSFFFTSVDPQGVSQFRITENQAGTEPIVESVTFDTAITFVGSGPGSFSQTPIFPTPEPASMTMWLLGAAGLLAWRGRKVTF